MTRFEKESLGLFPPCIACPISAGRWVPTFGSSGMTCAVLPWAATRSGSWSTCYTGKAFAGLIRRAREGFYKPNDNVLFVHTGGAGGLFAQDWEE